jgi:DNA polymerase-3 subunit delta'
VIVSEAVAVAQVGGVFADVVGQPAAVEICRAAVVAAQDGPGRAGPAMTHAWLFTGPPGSGRSVAARAFAAALQCRLGGCGACPACRTVLAGTHADVRAVVPEGLSISVREMRAVVQRAASRPQTAPWQIVLIEDADRLTEGASNALLKSIEEPPPHTVFLLCAPSTHPDDVSVTIRSRCRVGSLVTPPAAAIAEVLVQRDGVEPGMAEWAASVCGGHVGRARALARTEASRSQRATVLGVPGALRNLADVFAEADALFAGAKTAAAEQAERRDEAERDELKIAYGAGGTGKGTAAATRGMAGALKDLERVQKARATRTMRDVLDRALVDLSGFYRDVIVYAAGSRVELINPDVAGDVHTAATRIGAEGALRRLDAVLECRAALERNVKPDLAIEALMMQLRVG